MKHNTTYTFRIYTYNVNSSSSSNNYSIWDDFFVHVNSSQTRSTDIDGVFDHLDLDSDDDGIPDNIEAQSTSGYQTPSGTVNTSGPEIGLWDNYGTGLTTENTDNSDLDDYIDTDSDNDGIPDIQENGMANAISGTDTDNDGLDDIFEGANTNDPTDVNDEINNPSSSILPDSDADLLLGGDLDYRDNIDVFFPSAAFNFDGLDDYVEVPISVLNSLDTFTLSFWIKPESLPTGNTFDRRFVIGQKDMFEIELSGQDNDPHIFTRHSYGTGPSSGGIGVVINDTNWMHYTVTVNYISERISIYINGDLVGSTGMGGPRLTNTNPFRIGSRADTQPTVGDNFNGWIDEVRIFDTLLTTDQIKRMVFQEIENNAGNVHGSIIDKDIIDIQNNQKIPWNNLVGYYPVTNITNSKVKDESVNNNTAILYNMNSLLPQTAPMPFETVSDGDWSQESTWLHGDVWDIENFEELFTELYQESPEPWSIVHIKNNITTSTEREALGMIIDENRSLTTIGDVEIKNNWHLQLDGTLDLQDDSQLIQTENSDLVTSADGKILRRQEGNSNSYWYNYWASPVGNTAATSLSNNNGSANNTNNTPFNLSMLKEGNGDAVTFTSAFNNTGDISTRWLYTFQNGLTYWNWVAIDENAAITPGFGYTQKGTGNSGSEQQYIFEGKPNNGTILLAADDVDGDSGNESEQDVTMTTSLIGNPYPSALDARQFI
ncbi:LamG domain-containing protein, partial [Muriicola sp.]|uniref:LamG domain-containing protein n=1 Tax=Muriicola sp. TaxID=2020856 RepID=UPI003C71B866